MVTGIDSSGPELLLDSEDLVVLGESVGSAGSSTLDLTSAETDDQVSNEVIFSLTGSVRDHDTPSCLLGHVAGLDALGHGTNLVNLEEESVDELLVDTGLHTLGVGHEEVVTDDLNLLAHASSHLDISIEIILIEGILDGLNRVLSCESLIEINELTGCHNSVILAGLLAEVVLSSLGIIEL